MTEEQARLRVVCEVNRMLAHPKARKLLLYARRLADPNASTPEIREAIEELGPWLDDWVYRP